MKRLLIIDDELGSRESLREVFHKRYEVVTADSAAEGLKLLGQQRFHLILADVIMPGMDGFMFLKKVREIYPEIPVIMVSASFAKDTIGEAACDGAVAFARKPFNVPELRRMVEQSITASEAPLQIEILEKAVVREFSLLNVVGQSPAFRKTIEEAREAAKAGGHLLIVGELGTGKEFLARQIHSWSARGGEPFFGIACGEGGAGEIFGHARSEGGHQLRGALDSVGGGTVFLDEVGRLPAPVQEAIADVIVTGQFQRVGSAQAVPTDVRVIATVSQCLAREDVGLAAKLVKAFGAAVIRVPPLRERPEDIAHLAYHFLNQMRGTLNARTLDIDAEAMQKLREYSWPGNIRELRNVIERMVVLCGEEKSLKASALPKEFHAEVGGAMAEEPVTDFAVAVQGFERRLIVDALERSKGVVRMAAEILHTTPRILQYRIDKLKIKILAQ